MILEPCNVELTKVHYYDSSKTDRNLGISTISREIGDRNFNRDVVIKKNVFGHRWVLKINEGEKEEEKKTKLKLVVYVLVFCSIVVAVGFGIFFSIYKNRYKPPEHKILGIKPIVNTTEQDDVHLYKIGEDQTTLKTTEEMEVIPEEAATTSIYIEVPSTTVSTMCGFCSFAQEVCLKLHETDIPKCVKIIDRNDPTGCGGLCPINTHFCQILDVRSKVYQCSPVKKSLVCPNNNFNCGNMCISQEKRCDGMVHCSNGSDEEKCDCDLETHFQCGNATSCLEKKKQCDHKVDCWDKTDETNCTKAADCDKEEIPCFSGQCVPKDKFCDGFFDCLDRTDEPDGCQM